MEFLIMGVVGTVIVLALIHVQKAKDNARWPGMWK